eukprot:1177797-Prorocentrum_minimum.AAC.2
MVSGSFLDDNEDEDFEFAGCTTPRAVGNSRLGLLEQPPMSAFKVQMPPPMSPVCEGVEQLTLVNDKASGVPFQMPSDACVEIVEEEVVEKEVVEEEVVEGDVVKGEVVKEEVVKGEVVKEEVAEEEVVEKEVAEEEVVEEEVVKGEVVKEEVAEEEVVEEEVAEEEVAEEEVVKGEVVEERVSAYASPDRRHEMIQRPAPVGDEVAPTPPSSRDQPGDSAEVGPSDDEVRPCSGNINGFLCLIGPS